MHVCTLLNLIHFQALEIDRCSMLEVDHYDVMISSSKSERMQEKFYTTLFMHISIIIQILPSQLVL